MFGHLDASVIQRKEIEKEEKQRRTKTRVRTYEKLNKEKIAHNLLVRRLKVEYGLTLEQFQSHEDMQGGVCAICCGPPVTRKRLDVDHNHTTGRVRGLLCSNCNTTLGRVGDTYEDLQRWTTQALSYLYQDKDG